MKKSLLSLAVIAVSLSACDTTPKYNINGTITGGEANNVYLLQRQGRTIDTLAKAPVAEGKFKLTGSVAGLTPAFIVVEGQRGRDLIFVENADFTATLNLENPTASKIEGTATQGIANQYTAISNEMGKMANELNQSYRTAYQEKDEAKMKELQEQYENLMKDYEAKEDAINKANADSYVAAYILAGKLYEYDYEKLVEKFNTLGENAKATEPGKTIADRIQKLSAVAVGQVAPDFTLNTPDGKPLSMHSIKGKVKVIDFWASWCGPCQMQSPVVDAVAESMGDQVKVCKVNVDEQMELEDKDAWLKAIEDDKLTWNHVSDLKGWQNAAAQLYCVNGIPHLVVLDENNVIVAKDLRGEELQNKVAELLK